MIHIQLTGYRMLKLLLWAEMIEPAIRFSQLLTDILVTAALENSTKKDDKSGMNYWRITSPKTDLGDKMLYDPVLALNKINENSDHYTTMLYHLMNDYKNSHNGKEGLIMVSFDTELFGHWWFEGIEFIKQVIKKFHNYIPQVERMTAGVNTCMLIRRQKLFKSLNHLGDKADTSMYGITT